jgi:hypothetical protein
MWIQTSNKHLVSLRSEHTNGELVEFNESGTAQVTEAVGESMIDHYDSITEYNNE